MNKSWKKEAREGEMNSLLHLSGNELQREADLLQQSSIDDIKA